MKSLASKRPNTSNGEYSFITVFPKNTQHPNQALTKLKLTQIAQKSDLQTVDINQTGIPGLHPLSAQQLQFQTRMKQMLQDLIKQSDCRPSLINFSPVTQHQLVRQLLPPNAYTKPPLVQYEELLYKVYKTESRLVRAVLENAGFQLTDSHDWNIMWLGTSAKPYLYQGLNQYQRINHFPNSYEITKKDRLCVSIVSMQEKFGRDAFDFIPNTYVLPQQYQNFYQEFNRQKEMWILKPSSSSRGRGIFVIDSLSEVPCDQHCIISRYISNPLLIKGLKFDLRIYVLITSFEPLKIYVYNQGLARFASEPYTTAFKHNKFVHLTNYSVNKKNYRFVQNTDWKQDDVGHKWSIKALLRHLQSIGIDTQLLWSKIYDMIIKTILSIQHIIVEEVRRLALHRNNCFDLFGFDVMIDQNLKPWLLQVNLSPSLATDSPIDLHIKSSLIADTFNLIGIRSFNRKKQNVNKARTRIRARQNQITTIKTKNLLDQTSVKPQFFYSSKFKSILKESLQQFRRKNSFIRIYPAQNSKVYDQFFSVSRLFNKALYQALFQSALERQIPEDPKRPSTTSSGKSPQRSTIRNNPKLNVSSVERKLTDSKRKGCGCRSVSSELCSYCKWNLQESRIVISGDDILIEYIQRVIQALKTFAWKSVKIGWKQKLENFISHYVWKNIDDQNLLVLKRLENRLSQMKERRKIPPISKVLKDQILQKKQGIIKGFSAFQLEEMLKKSSKSVVKEVVGCLIDQEGLLSSMIKFLANSNTHGQTRNIRTQFFPESEKPV